jgi:phage gp45-like
MAFRSTVRDAAMRVMVGTSRGTLKKANDQTLMQEVNMELLAGEEIENAERPQPYGVTHVPHNEEAWPDENKKGHVAELFIAFMGGNRSHPIVLVVDDRRYRICGQKEGELMLHDEQGHQIQITRDGVFVSVPHDKFLTARVMRKDAGKPDAPTKVIQSSMTNDKNDDVLAWMHFDMKTYTMTHRDKDKDKDGNEFKPTIIEQIIDKDGKPVSKMEMDATGVTWTAPRLTFNAPEQNWNGENFTWQLKKWKETAEVSHKLETPVASTTIKKPEDEKDGDPRYEVVIKPDSGGVHLLGMEKEDDAGSAEQVVTIAGNAKNTKALPG